MIDINDSTDLAELVLDYFKKNQPERILKYFKNIILEVKLTLIGKEGLDNITDLLEKVKTNNIPGDFLEAGVWRGGACIWARLVMNYLGIKAAVIACDSFKGLPKADPKYIMDRNDIHHTIRELAISEQQVKENFDIFKPLEEVIFVKGWFKDAMPQIKKLGRPICILRIDGDMYESTILSLDNLYDLVSKGGFIIVDDYALLPARRAIDYFRKKRKIKQPLIKVTDTIYYWEKI